MAPTICTEINVQHIVMSTRALIKSYTVTVVFITIQLVSVPLEQSVTRCLSFLRSPKFDGFMSVKLIVIKLMRVKNYINILRTYELVTID
jgi:hypothetical protein